MNTANKELSAMALHSLQNRARPLALHTYEETAAALGISIDRVRTIEKTAFRKLKNNKLLRAVAAEAGYLKENEE